MIRSSTPRTTTRPPRVGAQASPRSPDGSRIRRRWPFDLRRSAPQFCTRSFGAGAPRRRSPAGLSRSPEPVPQRSPVVAPHRIAGGRAKGEEGVVESAARPGRAGGGGPRRSGAQVARSRRLEQRTWDRDRDEAPRRTAPCWTRWRWIGCWDDGSRAEPQPRVRAAGVGRRKRPAAVYYRHHGRSRSILRPPLRPARRPHRGRRRDRPCGACRGYRMRTRARHHRPRYRVITAWPAEARAPAEVAAEVRYVGSPEHKGHWSPGFNPSLRSDASECPPDLSLTLEANTRALHEAIIAGCVGAQFEDGFPKYVWGWIGGQLYEARHIRGPVGTYKAFPLDAIDTIEDSQGFLGRLRAASESA